MPKLLRVSVLLVSLVIFSYPCLFAESVSPEARRHLDRGRAAVKMAKSPADYEEALRELEAAKRLAPGWAAVYYPIGLIQDILGRHDEALKNLRIYLSLTSHQKNKQKAQSLINEIEYKKEKMSNIAQILPGRWMWGALEFTFVVSDGDIKVKLYTGWDCSHGMFIDYKAIPVTKSGDTLCFDYIENNKDVKKGKLEQQHQHIYRLKLVSPNKLKGTRSTTRILDNFAGDLRTFADNVVELIKK